MMKSFSIALTIIVSWIFVGSAAYGAPVGIQKPRDVRDAPSFQLEDLNGKKHRIEDYRGKVVLVHFWATWCLPCKDEMPTLKALWERMKEKDFVILAVAEDSRKAAGAFAGQYGLPFAVLVDQYGGAMRSYAVRFMPTTVIVGRAGRIEGIAPVSIDWTSPETIGVIEGLLSK